MPRWRRVNRSKPCATRLQASPLIELLIVIAIIAILLAIAFPSYQDYVRRANRSEAKNQLLLIGAEQEKFFTTFNRYAEALAGPRTGNPLTSGLNMGVSAIGDATTHYLVTVVLVNNGLSYTLTATPQSAFQSYDSCGALTVNNVGVRRALGASAPPNCW